MLTSHIRSCSPVSQACSPASSRRFRKARSAIRKGIAALRPSCALGLYNLSCSPLRRVRKEGGQLVQVHGQSLLAHGFPRFCLPKRRRAASWPS